MEKQKKLRVLNFEPFHLDLMDIREHEMEGLFQMPEAIKGLSVLAEACEDCKTIMVGTDIVGCAGYVKLWGKVAECWLIPSSQVKENKIIFSKFVKGYMDRIVGELGYERLQTTCLNDKLHCRWMRFLGFEREGVLRKYSAKGEDFGMFARVV